MNSANKGAALQPITAEIKNCDAIRSQGGGFIDKIAKRSPQRFVVEIAGADDLKACRFQRLRDQTCVVGSSFKRSGFIGSIA